MKQMKFFGLSALALSAVLAFQAPALADHHGGAIEAALMSPDRPSADKERDGARKPAEVLAFAGLQPGMTVVDINSATGWYTEVLSHAVGPKGKVYAHNGPYYWGFVKDRVAERYDGRLPNVVQIHDGEVLDLPSESVDMIFLGLAYHDYFAGVGKREMPDIAAVLASFMTVLKPGGSVVIVDHVAPMGSGIEAGDTLHRIDPALVKAQMTEAGFMLIDESGVLANADDDHTKGPFDPMVRGKTDRFILKFVK